MVELTASRVSALASHYTPGHHGAPGNGVIIRQTHDLQLWQLAAWPDSLQAASQQMQAELGLSAVPGFAQAVTGGGVSALRIEPLKFWVHGARLATYDAAQAVTLDLSHSRTQLTVSGPYATTLLNGYLPLDLRESKFPVGSVASSAFHHVGVTLWRSEAGYELFLPRGFALSLWELLQQSAAQYGLMIE